MNQELVIALGSAMLTSIIGPVAVHYARVLIDTKKKRRESPLSEAIKINNIVSEKLGEVRETYKADRVWCIQFHNGGHFYPTGKSIQKFSMTHELLKPSIVPCQTQLQSIPVSLFSRVMDTLEKGSIISVYNVKKDILGIRGITSEIQGSGVKSTYVIPIFNIRGEFVAAVGVDYVEKLMELDDDRLTELEIDVSTIGGVINNYLKS